MSRRWLLAVLTLVAGSTIGAAGVWVALDVLGEPVAELRPDRDDPVTEQVDADDSGGDGPAVGDERTPTAREEPEGRAGVATGTSDEDAGPDSSVPPELPDPPVPPAPPELVRDLATLLAAEEVRSVDRLSVVVLDEAGREVASLEPDEPVMPASTAKLVTAAAAYRMLGPDYRFVTRVFATAEPVDGVVDGDLVLVGSGDPALASPTFITRVYPARPHTELDVLASLVAANGIREIRGSVVGDPRLFAAEPIAEGWADRYLFSLDATRVSGLTVDAGRRIWERGEDLLGEADEEPARLAADVLAQLLAERGVRVEGEALVGEAPDDALEVARLHSPPLRDLLTHTVQESDNHMADGVFRTLGARAGAGTWEASEQAVKKTLGDVPVDWDQAIMADGSGLSRASLLTARILADLDRVMTLEYGPDWQGLLAVAGESGTLRKRMRGTVAEGLLAGKTGALRDARSLAGQVSAPDGRRYHFAIAGSDLDGNGIGVVRGLMDDLVIVLAGGPPPPPVEQEEQTAGGG